MNLEKPVQSHLDGSATVGKSAYIKTKVEYLPPT